MFKQIVLSVLLVLYIIGLSGLWLSVYIIKCAYQDVMVYSSFVLTQLASYIHLSFSCELAVERGELGGIPGMLLVISKLVMLKYYSLHLLQLYIWNLAYNAIWIFLMILINRLHLCAHTLITTVETCICNWLRGVKDWVHRKTAKIIHDFNSFCNLDMNKKLVSVMIIKISYLCTLHNEIISPAHLCCLHVVAVNAHLLQH